MIFKQLCVSHTKQTRIVTLDRVVLTIEQYWGYLLSVHTLSRQAAVISYLLVVFCNSLDKGSFLGKIQTSERGRGMQ